MSRTKETVREGFEKLAAGTGASFHHLAPDAKWTIVGNAPVSRNYNSKQERPYVAPTPCLRVLLQGKPAPPQTG